MNNKEVNRGRSILLKINQNLQNIRIYRISIIYTCWIKA